jgi:putative sterol carrier protein
MAERAKPPDDIPPEVFFTEWIPTSVAGDASRGRQLGATQAQLVFALVGEGGGDFTLEIDAGAVVGRAGRAEAPDLVVTVDVETWRALNRGDLSAPEALLRRKVHLAGDMLLALKLHLILG